MRSRPDRRLRGSLKRRVWVAVFVTVMAGAVARSFVNAQQQPPPPAPAAADPAPSDIPAFVQPTLQQENDCFADNGLKAVRHFRTGAFRFIGSEPGRPIRYRARQRGTTPSGVAREYLARCGSLFGVANATTDMSVSDARTLPDRRSFVRFQQKYNDIPVMGGELVLNMDGAQRILSATGELLPNAAVPTARNVNPPAARAQALASVAATYHVSAALLSTSTPELWIYNPALLGAGEGPTVLVWRMEVTGAAPLVIREVVLIGAERGDVVLQFSRIESALNRLTYTANNTSSLPGTLVCNESNPTCSGGDTHAVAAHQHAADTYNFYLTTHGRDSIDNAGMTLRSTVHYQSGYANAFWDGTQMVYGDAAGYPLADDVVGHELTHGVTQYTSNLVYMNESGAINESFSDIWGEFVDQTNGRGNDSAAVKWLMGEDVSGLGAIRNMKDPTAFADPDRMGSPLYYTGTSQSAFVHINSGVGNKAAYLMVDGGTFNGQTITGLGITKVAKIYYEAQTHLLTSGADYADLADALVQGCSNLVGTSGIVLSDCDEVRKATFAVEMRLASETCASVQTVALQGLTTSQASPDIPGLPAGGTWSRTPREGGETWSYSFNVALANGATGGDAAGASSSPTELPSQTAAHFQRQDVTIDPPATPPGDPAQMLAPTPIVARPLQPRAASVEDRGYPDALDVAGQPAARAAWSRGVDWSAYSGLLEARTSLKAALNGNPALSAFELSLDERSDLEVASARVSAEITGADPRQLTVWLAAGGRDFLLWDGKTANDNSPTLSIDRFLDRELAGLPIGGRWTLYVSNASPEPGGVLESASVVVLGKPASVTVVGQPARADLATADIVADVVYMRNVSGVRVTTPALGQTTYFSGEILINGSGGPVAFNNRLALDGTTFCSELLQQAPGSRIVMSCMAGWVATAGSHTLSWNVDYANAVEETDESNNSVAAIFTLSSVDLVAQNAHLRTAPVPGGSVVLTPSVGQTVYLHGSYQINGSGSAVTYAVRLVLDGATFCAGTFTDLPGTSWTSNCNTAWVATAGGHQLDFEVDYTNTVPETNEGNNFANKSWVSLSGVDLSATSASLRSAPNGGGSVVATPTVGQTVYFHGTYQIAGSGTVFYVVQMTFDGSDFCHANFTDPANTAWGFSCTQGWVATAGSHTLSFDVDLGNLVAETNEGNNSAIKTFTTTAPSLDIEAQSAYLRTAANGSGSVVAAPTLGQTVFLHLDWRVTGSGSAATVTQRALVDGQVVCSCVFQGTPGVSYRSSCSEGWVVTPGSHTLTWELDDGNTIPESNESNNSVSMPVAAPSPAPTLTTITPTAVTAGGGDFALTVQGTDFVSTSVVQVDGGTRPTTVVSETSLLAALTAADRAIAGTHVITVFTPTPGGGTSSAATLTVNGPVITLASSTVAAGGIISATLTNGSGNRNDWVGLYCPASGIDVGHIAWKYLSDTKTPPPTGLTTATLTFPAPLTGGTTCNLRWFFNDGLQKLATSATLTVEYPVPAITMLSPTSTIAGGSAFTLTVTGTGFAAGATVQVDGSDRASTVVSSTSITAALLAADIAAAGTRTITVVNPAPGGGPSSGATLTVLAPPPAPTLATLNPTAVSAGGGSFSLAVTGTGFIATSVVQVDGVARPTTFTSSTALTAMLTAADRATATTLAITVMTPAPGGGTSSAATLTVNGPVITLASPSVAAGGTVTATLSNGSGNRFDWVAFYCPAAGNDLSYLTYRYLSNTMTPPAIGLTTATLTFPAPTANGVTCNLRWFFNDGLTKLATSATLTVENPVPAITTLSPGSAVAGSADFTLTVTGTGFAAGATVRVDGSDRVSTVVSSTSITAAILAADVAAIGTHAITVFNPAPGGGESAGSTLTVTAPPLAPTLTSINPTTVNAGGAGFAMAVAGTDFVATSIVQVDGVARPTTFNSATSLTAMLTAADRATATTHAITVMTPAPGGGTSSAATLTVNGPLITLASPSVTAGGTITATLSNGTGNRFDWVAFYCPATGNDLSYLAYKYLGNDTRPPATGLTTAIVTFVAPMTNGATCNLRWFFNDGLQKLATSATVTVENPVPTITTLSPGSAVAGGAAFTLTVTGTGFVTGATVRVNGSDRVSTVVSSTSITAAILAADVAAIGTPAITVFNPAPGGGESASSILTITAPPPAPTLKNINPTTVNAGGAGFTVTATGTDFVATSVVQVDGVARPTTFNSATSLTAMLTAADRATATTHAITVVTPAPGGGTSSAATLTVNGPLITLAAPSVTAGGIVSATLSNGTGNRFDWVAFYCPAAGNDLSYLAYKYLGNDTRPPATGLTTAIVTFVAPMTKGATCNLRWFFNDGLQKLATSATLTVENPAPTITTLSPASAVAGTAAFTLTVTGTGFVTGATVRVDGSDRVSTVVSSTSITAAILATDVAAIGTHAITVFNPAPGGGESASSTLTVTAPPPAPTLTSINPTTVNAGGAGFTVTATGTDFVATSVVQVDGIARPTTFVSQTSLTATLTAADRATATTHAITVMTPSPGGGTSSASTLTVDGPLITLAAPSVAAGGTVTATLSNGTGNRFDWVAFYCPATGNDISYLTYRYLSNTMTPPATGLTTATLTFPAPTTNGVTCNLRWFFNDGLQKLATSATLTVENPVPTITALSPSSAVAGGAAFTLTVTGTGFVTGATVRVDGSDRASTVVSSTSITAAILAADVAAIGTHAITVFNPAPGGGVSTGSTLTVIAPPPAPTLTSIDPTTVNAGGAGFTVAVTGTDFVATSVVQVDGVARPTTFTSATSLTAMLTAADRAMATTHAITVVTPAPGGGTSSAATLTVNGPLITLDSSSVAAGGTVTATLSNGTGNRFDWVAFYCPATGNDISYLTYRYLSNTMTPPATGLTTATLTFPAPTTIGVTCNLRWFFNDGLQKLATSATLTIDNPVPTITTLTPSSAVAGGEAFTLTVTGTGFVTGATVRVDGSNRVSTVVSSTSITAAILAADIAAIGTPTITVVNPGTGARVSSGKTLSVITPPTITLASSSFPSGGTISATLSNGSGNRFDWVAIYCPATGNDLSYLTYRYLNNTMTPPATGLTSATLTFPAPITTSSVTCNLRWFFNDGLQKLATSATVTVSGPLITLGATSVAAGRVITATVSNGPGNRNDWVGLYCSSTGPDRNYVGRKYLSNTQTPPPAGLTDATITFSAPLTTGAACDLRWFVNDSSVNVATSATLTVVDGDLIVGVVTNRTTGQPVANAQVFFYGGVRGTVFTDALGQYRFRSSDLAPSGGAISGTLYVGAPGYFEAPLVSVDLGSAPSWPEVHNVSLLPGGTMVQGVVRDAGTGQGLGGVLVLFNHNPPSIGGTTAGVRTAPDGSYAIDSSYFTESGLTTGFSIGLQVDVAGYLGTSRGRNFTSYPVTEDFGLQLLTTGDLIAGVVTNRTTGQPVANAQVFFYGGVRGTVFTDVLGQYRFRSSDLAPAGGAISGTLYVGAPGYFEAPLVSVDPGSAPSWPQVHNVSLLPGGTMVQGVVRDAGTGQGLGDVLVLFNHNPPSIGGSPAGVRTAPDGSYAIDSSYFTESGLTTGFSIGLHVEVAGYLGTSQGRNFTSYPVTEDFGLQLLTTGDLIAGVVTNRTTGQPVANAQVFFYGGVRGTVFTDVLGQYRFRSSDLAPAGGAISGTLYVGAPGYFEAPLVSVDLGSAPSWPEVHNVSLLPGGTMVQGVVRDAGTGQGLGGVLVLFNHNPPSIGGTTGGVRTAPDGSYAIDSSYFTESGLTTGFSIGLQVDVAGYLGTSRGRNFTSYPVTEAFSLLPVPALTLGAPPSD